MLDFDQSSLAVYLAEVREEELRRWRSIRPHTSRKIKHRENPSAILSESSDFYVIPKVMA